MLQRENKTWKKIMALILLIGLLVWAGSIFAAPSAPSAQKPAPTPSVKAARQNEPQIIPGRIIVVVAAGSEKTMTAAKSLSNQKISATRTLGKSKKGQKTIMLVNISGKTKADVFTAITQAKKMPGVLYAAPDYVVQATVEPNDPDFPQLYGMQQISAPEAWDITTGDPSVIVGVIDTGIDYNHPDLQANIWTNPGEIPDNGIDDDGNGFIDDIHGWDFVNNDNDPFDDNHHGTHVAGTIAAVGNNGIGVVGVTWRTKVAAIKFLDSGGFGSTSGAISSFLYANGEGFPITNNSWGGGPFDQTLMDVIAEGGLAVCAAGNNASNNDTNPFYPASYDLDNIVSVLATDSENQPASFTNFGKQTVDLGAPGVDILSTFPNNDYQFLSGTSMATPHVVGTAALLKAFYPFLTTAELKEKLITHTDKLSQLEDLVLSGGRLNAFKALNQIAPGKIEAEQYIAQSGIRTEPTSDTGGGLDVTDVNTGDFMDYQVDVQSPGNYIIDFRVASAVGTGRIELRNEAGTPLVTINVPNTGGLQRWQTVRSSVVLPQEVLRLRVFAVSGAWNLNWMNFIYNSAPGKVEAEDFSTMSGITTETTSDEGGGLDVTNVNTGDFLDYVINVQTTGRYLISWRVASQVATGQIQLRNSSGAVLSSVNVPNTGGLQTWRTITSGVLLTAGIQTLRVFAASGAWNLNWFDFELEFKPIPGKVEAEDFAAMNGVTIITASDLGGGSALTFDTSGDYADYQVNVSAAGRYLVQYRIASGSANGQIHLKDSTGNVLAVTLIPNTGGGQNWQLAVATVELPAGNQIIRVFAAGVPFNLNWMNFLPEYTVIPGKIEAENYSAQSGVLTEITTDTGNVFNITSIDPGDFLDYKVNNVAPGAHDVQLRVANPGTAGKLDLKIGNGLVLATVNVPSTGGAQSWQTVTITTSIIQGQQTLRIQGNTGSLKLNWINFVEKPESKVNQIAAGSSFSLAVESDGTPWSWGANFNGQLGDGTNINRTVPTQVVNLSGVKSMDGGSSHSLAVKTNGTVWAWGANFSGQLGNGTQTDSLIPVQVSGLSGVTAVAAGSGFSMALKSDGTVWAWGENFIGQLGDGTNDQKLTPVQTNITGVKAITAGGSSAMALKTDGTVWAWGANFDGELGDGTNESKNTPVQALNLSNVKLISMGSFHSLAVKTDGSVWAWGANFSGQLGDGTNQSSNVPVQTLNLNNVIAIDGGGSHSLAVKNDGAIFSWGANFSGQLGDGTFLSRNVPVQVQNLADAKAVAAGDSFSLVLQNTGVVWGFGDNGNGQLGDGTSNFSGNNLPIRTLPLFPETWITLDDQSSSITYAGTWTNNGTTHSSATTCSTATFSFTGTRLRIFGNKTPDSGLAEVVIDGVSVGHPDFNNFIEVDSTFIFESQDLPYGNHTVKLIVLGFHPFSSGVTVTIDFFQYLSFTKIDDADSKVVYSSGWTAETGKPGYLGTDHISNTAGSLASFTFLGTKVRYNGLKGPDFGFVQIYLDDLPRAMIDCYSATRQYDVQLFESEDLPFGIHTLRVRVNGTKSPSSTGTKVAVDSLSYIK